MPINLALILTATGIALLMYYWMFNFKVRLYNTGKTSITASIIMLVFYVAITTFVFAVPTTDSNSKSNVVFNAMYLLTTTCYSLFSSSLFLRIARLNTPKRRILNIYGLTSSIVYAVILIILKLKYL